MAQSVLIAHGGAGNWDEDNHDAVLVGMREAVEVGWKVLQQGGTALDAVEQTTIILEDHPLYDAGFGSFLNEQGEIELDALITDGATRKFGAVAVVHHVKNPITLARHVMTDTNHCFFAGNGADQLALTLGIPSVANLSLATEAEIHAYIKRRETNTVTDTGRGTVGAIALDSQKNIASATSTGGVPNKKKGRVGDSPMYGAGGYALNNSGGASATGLGENIMRFFLSKQVVDNIHSGMDAQSAAQAGVDLIESHIQKSEVGVIVIDVNGNVGAAHSTRKMPIAWVDANGNIHAEMGTPYSFSSI